MSRTLTAAVQAELAKARSEPIHLLEAYFEDATVRVTDAAYPITWNGNLYTALGHFISFDGLEENSALRETRVRVALSGVDQVWISSALADNYLDRRLVIYRAFLNGQGGVVIDPVAIFDGVMDFPAISEDPQAGGADAGMGNCTVAVEASSHWADFGRRPGRHTNDNEQQLYFPGDSFFEFVSEQNRQIQWGGGVVRTSDAGRFGSGSGGGYDPENVPIDQAVYTGN